MIPFLKLLDEVVNPPKKPQEKLVEGTKAFGEGIKEAVKKNRVFWHEVIVDGYLDNGKNVITKTQRNKKKPRK